MKKLTRKLFISILSMAFAVIAIGTTTFAWITISTTAEVQAFDASVEAGAGGIEVSWDQVTWSTLLTGVMEKTDGEYTHINTDFAGFSDVCYDNENGFYDIKINGQTAVKEKTGGTDDAPTYDASTAKYITFTFYVKNTNATQPITLKVSGTTFGSYTSTGAEASGFTSDISFNYTDGTEKPVTAAQTVLDQFVVANAARMMIKAGNNASVIYEQAADNKNNTTHAEIDITNGAAHAYFHAKQYEFADDLDKTSYSTNAPTTSTTLCTLAGGTTTSVTVTIWVEGWDNECHANILSQVLKSSISLEAASN